MVVVSSKRYPGLCFGYLCESRGKILQSERWDHIKPAIDDLKAKLDKKHEELSASQKLLEDYQEQTQRAAEFSEIVRLVKHDLKGPLSVLKFAASPKANETESKEALQSSIASIER